MFCEANKLKKQKTKTNKLRKIEGKQKIQKKNFFFQYFV